jgi:hypothetical protein
VTACRSIDRHLKHQATRHHIPEDNNLRPVYIMTWLRAKKLFNTKKKNEPVNYDIQSYSYRKLHVFIWEHSLPYLLKRIKNLVLVPPIYFWDHYVQLPTYEADVQVIKKSWSVSIISTRTIIPKEFTTSCHMHFPSQQQLKTQLMAARPSIHLVIIWETMINCTHCWF